MPLFASAREAEQYWGPIEPGTPPTVTLCPNKPQDTAFYSYWVYKLPDLQPGVYELHSILSSDRPIIDGGDNDGDGKLDHWVGWWQESRIIIEVVE